MRTRDKLLATTFLLGAAVVAGAPACERYEPPPTVTIGGLEGGLLFDSKAPLFLDFGHSHLGFTLGPVTGRLAAEMIVGERPFADPRPFSPTRFANA